jgi:MFS transporter, FSR family, fosmidomycin resistance protein
MASSSNTSSSLGNRATLGQDARIIGLVGLAHMISHFSQLILPPLFPWLKEAFNASYTELGFLMTVFFVASCMTQTLSGFWVDKFGPRPILFLGLTLLGVAAFGFGLSSQYWMMACCSAVAGVGNGVFHPVDYTLLNRKVSPSRLGHAYSTHGITGSLGWALAPLMMVPLAIAFSWRIALMSAGASAFVVLALLVLALLVLNRAQLAQAGAMPGKQGNATDANATKAHASGGDFDFLKLPAVWMCFSFFLLYAVVISVIQAFAPEAARQLHGVPITMAAACLTIYMVSGAGGMIVGGFLVKDPSRCETLVALAFAVAAIFSLALGFIAFSAAWVPFLFGAMGFASGLAGPSRDLLIKKSTPENATGRVYGVVYSGLDIGQAFAPLVFGRLMDHQQFSSVFLGLALVQCTLIASALMLGKGRRSRVQAAG